MIKQLVFFCSLLLVLTGCTDQFEPAIENNRGLEDSYNDPRFAQGLLINGYARIPNNGWAFSDMATDNAVSNNPSNNYSQAATGQWASNYNPFDEWNRSKAAIQYINLMLTATDSVTYSNERATNMMFNDRIKGEAYGLRGMFMYYLLQAHAGMVNGELLGVPMPLEPEGVGSNFNVSRPTFQECIDQLFADLDESISLLPLDYANIGDPSAIPDKYLAEDGTIDGYNRAFGDDAKLLLSGRIARAIKAQAALMAASPRYSSGSSVTWDDAANFAADVIDENGGVAGLAANGLRWFSDPNQIDGIGGGNNPPEILWRTSIAGPSTSLETTHFPPTLFGNGLLNPTQNLVDAFPMANGYPIDDPASGYDASNPYAGRDPRLAQFIIYDESTAGSNNSVIHTAVDGGTNDGLNRVETSTRTGYYMRKLLRQDVNLNPVSTNGQRHIQPRIRYTEIYLIYAEAANEAWGPTGTGPNGYSAYDVIKAIRERAGLGANGNDPYLDAVRGDQNAMRDLIHNERRLELCFEGYRFWDLRRWDENLTEPARGVRIEDDNYSVFEAEERLYQDYMIYGPVPYSEILKFNMLQQNNGW